jgi:hypothetical protein
MRYRTHRAFPVGGVMIPGETDIDASTYWGGGLLIGLVPPPDVTPLDQECANVLASAYRWNRADHG